MNRIHKRMLCYLAVFPAVFLMNLIFSYRFNQFIPYYHDSVSIICAALILVWSRTIQTRILQKNVRRCLFAVSIFLAALYVLRISKWTFFFENGFLHELIWELSYIPFIFVPLCSFQAADSLDRDENSPLLLREKFLWAGGVILCVGCLTNSLHKMLLEITEIREAEYHWGYYLVVAWSVLLTLAAVAVLVQKCRNSQCRRYLYVPFVSSVCSAVCIAWYYTVGGSPELFGARLFYSQDIYSLLVIGFWEGCILIGLLPSNSGYHKLFVQSHINARLLDGNGNTMFRSQAADISEDEDHISHTQTIRGGSIIWTEDVHGIRGLERELEEANESLEEENDLIEEENRIAAERASFETQNRLYDKVAAHSNRELSKIAESFSDKEAFANHLRYNLLLGTYVKRSSNLMLLADGSANLTSDELFWSVRETMECMTLLGIDCMLEGGEAVNVPAACLIDAYDLMQKVIDNIYNLCSVLCVKVMPGEDSKRDLTKENGRILLLIETDAAPGIGMNEGFENIQATVLQEDDTWRIIVGAAPRGKDTAGQKKPEGGAGHDGT